MEEWECSSVGGELAEHGGSPGSTPGPNKGREHGGAPIVLIVLILNMQGPIVRALGR